MQDKVIKNCELLVENKTAFNKVFFGQYDIINIAAAAELAGMGKTTDREMLRRCRSIIRESESIFSTLRGFSEMSIVTNMIASGDPEGFVTKVKKAFGAIGENFFFNKDDYLAFAAVELAAGKNEYEFESYSQKASEIYSMMKENHPFLTSKEDYPFAMLMAINNLDASKVMNEAERCFDILKSDYGLASKNSLQTVAFALAFCDKTSEEKCERLKRLVEKLKASGHRFSKDTTMAILAGFTMLDSSDEEIVEAIAAADDYLKGCRGFGDLTLGKGKRRMFAAQMVLSSCDFANVSATGAAISSSIAVNIAIGVTMMIICSTACAAAASSSN